MDQLFSILTTEFKSEIKSPDDLLNKIRNSVITPKPVCEELFYIWSWRDFVLPNLSSKKLENHSFLHSFLVKKEDGVGVLRGRKYPQDSGEWLPNDGIKLLKDGVDFSEVDVAEMRIEKLNLGLVFHGLYTKYFPQLPDQDKRGAMSSWEKLRTVLENLPKKKNNFPKLKLKDFPKQRSKASPVIPPYLQPFQADNIRQLVGARHVMEPQTSVFEVEIGPGMDVVLYTKQKSTRPWLGPVLTVMQGGKSFQVQWFKRRTKSLTFYSSANADGTPFTSIMSTDCVMMWNFSDNKTSQSFELSEEWLEKIMKNYSDHDLCYV